jgi:hypothetical protein
MLIEFVFHVEEESGMQYKNLRICKIIIERIACRTASLSGGRTPPSREKFFKLFFCKVG